jgi:hypothetical protein
MIKTDTEIHLNCLLIEKLVGELLLEGADDAELVSMVYNMFAPETIEQEEKYSKAILYGKFIILN